MNPNKITTTVGLNSESSLWCAPRMSVVTVLACFVVGKIDVKGARLMFWDLGGQEELQSLWDKYYAESHGIIYIIDSVDTTRIPESKVAFGRLTCLCMKVDLL